MTAYAGSAQAAAGEVRALNVTTAEAAHLTDEHTAALRRHERAALEADAAIYERRRERLRAEIGRTRQELAALREAAATGPRGGNLLRAAGPRQRHLDGQLAEARLLDGLISGAQGRLAALSVAGPGPGKAGAGSALAGRALDRLTASFAKLEGQLDPAVAKMREFEAAQALVAKAYDAGLIEGPERFKELLGQISERFNGGFLTLQERWAAQTKTQRAATKALSAEVALYGAALRGANVHRAALSLQMDKARQNLAASVTAMGEELRLAGLSERQRQIEITTRDLVNQAQADGLVLSEAETEQLRAQVSLHVDAMLALQERQAAERQAAEEWNRIWDQAARNMQDALADTHQTNWRFWPLFEPHHYLKLPHMIAATNYIAVVDGALVAHVAFSTRPGLREARACRLVVMPDWQGAGVGLRFLNDLCEMWLAGRNRYHKPMPTLFHTSHPGLAAALRRDRRWAQISCVLHAENGGKKKSAASIARSEKRKTGKSTVKAGYGGHFRAVQGFRYCGEPELPS